jgi:hypothetical protein
MRKSEIARRPEACYPSSGVRYLSYARGIAQLVERRSPKPQAVGSSPSAPAILMRCSKECMPAGWANQ